MIFITGKFDLEQGHPYFASLAVDQAKLTYVGNIPEHITFEFKYGPENSDHVNYVVLPLDTTIRTAKDLCEAKADDGSDLMSDDDNIQLWDVLTQNLIFPTNAYSCFEIVNIPNKNFNLNPGQIYRITVPSDKTWTQK